MMQALFLARQGQNPFASMFNTNTEVKISPKENQQKALALLLQNHLFRHCLHHPKAVMKRPSARALEFEVPKPTAADLEKKVNVYASRVWRQARLFVQNTLKLDDEAAKAFAKPKSQKARELFYVAQGNN